MEQFARGSTHYIWVIFIPVFSMIAVLVQLPYNARFAHLNQPPVRLNGQVQNRRQLVIDHQRAHR